MNYVIVFHTSVHKNPEFYHGSCPLEMSKMFKRVVDLTKKKALFVIHNVPREPLCDFS